MELGLGHFEGRGWRGFHHHATLCIAAYGFLISEREAIPPHDLVPPGLYEDAIVKGVFCWCLAILIALGYGYRRAVKPRSRLYP